MTTPGASARPGELLGRGQESEVLAWGEGAAIKVYRGPAAQAVAEQELRHLQLAAGAGVRVPEPRGVAAVDGRAGVIMERIHGRDVLDYIGRHPWKLDWGAEQLARAHVRLHRATAPADLRAAKAMFAEFLASDPRAAELLPEPVRSKGLALLSTLPEGHALCHGDFHPGNVFVQDGEVVVIDWPMMCRGTPECDVARSTIVMAAGAIPATGSRRRLLEQMRRLFIRRYLHHYRRQHPVDVLQLRQWRLLHALERYVTHDDERRALAPLLRKAFGVALRE